MEAPAGVTLAFWTFLADASEVLLPLRLRIADGRRVGLMGWPKPGRDSVSWKLLMWLTRPIALAWCAACKRTGYAELARIRAEEERAAEGGGHGNALTRVA